MSTDLPDYVLDPSPLAMFTRLQRVNLHLERMQAEAMAEIEMTFADYMLVATLHREPHPHALPVSRLADLVLRPMGSITQVVDRLEGSGLVVRRVDPADRRRVLIELTAEGVDIAERGDKAYRISRERVLSSLPAQEVHRADDAVTTLLLALEADQDPTPERSSGSDT